MKLFTIILVSSFSALATVPHGAHKVYSGTEVIQEITQYGLAQDLPGTLTNGDACSITYTLEESGLAVSIKTKGETTTVGIPNDAQIEMKALRSNGFTRRGYWFVAEGSKKLVSINKLDDGCDFDLMLWTGKATPVTCRFRE